MAIYFVEMRIIYYLM